MRKQKEIGREENDSHRYRIKSRECGTIFVSFTSHAKKRMKERDVDIIEALLSLTKASDKLVDYADNKESLLIDESAKLSFVLAVSQNEKEYYYFNVVTVLNEIPTSESDELRFSGIHHFCSV